MRSIELFSGAGGLALGLAAAGFKSVALVERNRDACRTLQANRPQWHVIETDVRDIAFSSLGPVDVVAGGPPCQPFSMGGKAKGSCDHRDMFPEATRAVRELRPKAFLFENVRGLLRPAFRNYVEFIRLQLSYPDFPLSQNVSWQTNFRRLERHHTSRDPVGGLGYKVTINLADAANYGVPQRRHRVFFVGFRDDIDAQWFFPGATHSQDELLRSQFVTGEYWREHGITDAPRAPDRFVARVSRLADAPLLQPLEPWRTVRDAIAGLGDPRSENPFPGHFFQSGARVYPGHTGSPLDEPSKALKAGDHGVPGGENMLRHSNGRVRYFSVRESARIQTFPENWTFSGSWTESMRQLGNAVPVKLAHTVAASVAKHISNDGRRAVLQSAGQAESREKHRRGAA